MKKILVIPGPNLNLLGQREPDIHGNLTLSEIDARLESRTRQKGLALTIVQSNQEGEIIEHIQKAAG
jgi:3-dehydroquinate dehydratase-2